MRRLHVQLKHLMLVENIRRRASSESDPRRRHLLNHTLHYMKDIFQKFSFIVMYNYGE